MASILSSVVLGNVIQSDGRRAIVERHIDNAGIESLIHYMAAVGSDVAAILAQHATQLALDLAILEIVKNVMSVVTNGSLATVTLIYSTAAANIAELRAFYLSATDRQSVMIGDYLSTLTNAQLQTAFSLTAGQVTTLRSNKLTPAATLAAQIRSNTGQ